MEKKLLKKISKLYQVKKIVSYNSVVKLMCFEKQNFESQQISKYLLTRLDKLRLDNNEKMFQVFVQAKIVKKFKYKFQLFKLWRPSSNDLEIINLRIM